MTNETFQIGEVANRTGLSLRTVRHYEAVGLAAPSGRTEGGFRLYTEPDVQRLLLVRALKPAEFSLVELQEIIGLDGQLRASAPDSAGRAEAEETLGRAIDLATQRVRVQRERLVAAELALEVLRRSTSPGPADAKVR